MRESPNEERVVDTMLKGLMTPEELATYTGLRRSIWDRRKNDEPVDTQPDPQPESETQAL